jgi:hypothetical protein
MGVAAVDLNLQKDSWTRTHRKGFSLSEHLPDWKWVFPTSQIHFSPLFQDDVSEWFDIYSVADLSLREE